MIYFDNAATSFPKPRKVVEAAQNALKIYGGNPGRSGHFLSVKTAEKVYDVREKIAAFFHYSRPENITFTYNATYALNTAIKALVPKDYHVLISDFEHNAVVRPIYKLSRENFLTFEIFNSSDDVKRQIEARLSPIVNTVICSLQSNVFGYQTPLQILSDLKKKYGFTLILDASQAVGHYPIDLGKYSFDAFCAPGHKSLYGACGCGFTIWNTDIPPETLMEGGSGTESQNPDMPMFFPDRFEAGTLGVPAILALGAGIDFLTEITQKAVSEKLVRLTALFANETRRITGIKVHQYLDNGIVSLNIDGADSETVARDLSERGICVRGGLHCSPLAHMKAKTLSRGGSVRFSFSVFNTEEEIYRAIKALNEITKKRSP